MTDLEEAIGHLGIIRTWAAFSADGRDDGIQGKCCENVRDWIDDALEILKAREPRVLTFDELKAISGTDTTVYVERLTKTYYNEMAFVSLEKVYNDYVFFHGQKSIFGYSKDDYGRTYRCWSMRPTKKQMEATMWKS